MSEEELNKLIQKYREDIIIHENYTNLPFVRKKNNEIAWIAVTKNKKSDSGKQRLEWANQKLQQLNITPGSPGAYAYLMYNLHPTKEKPCDCCGKIMSLDYIYLNKNFVKRVIKKFPELRGTVSETTSIYDLKNLISDQELKDLLINIFNFDKTNETIEEILEKCIQKSREGSKIMGPGAMSNFPDRLDGFHTYNRCCRKVKDKGRHDENMKQYSKDRRAYEYFSDGNFQRANSYMKSEYFNMISADHGGPISLGFIHDMFNLFPMGKSKNSAKRDRIILDYLYELIDIEKEKNITMMSWFSEPIWKFIKNDLLNISIENLSNKQIKSKEDFYYMLLKQNIINFMYFLNKILGSLNGELFIIEKLLKPKYVFFSKEYSFPTIDSYIETDKKLTEANEKEIPRLNRIAIESIEEFSKKDNRKHTEKINENMNFLLLDILQKLNLGQESFDTIFEDLQELMRNSCLFILQHQENY